MKKYIETGNALKDNLHAEAMCLHTLRTELLLMKHISRERYDFYSNFNIISETHH